MAFQTIMHEHCDGRKNPPIEHKTESAAVGYAKVRTQEKECDITVVDHNGRVIGVYEDGQVKENK